MKPNTAPNGVAYGYVAASDLDPELVGDLLYGNGVEQYRDLTFAAARVQDEAEQRAEWEEELETKSVKAQEEGIDIVHDDFEFDDDKHPNGYEISELEVEGIKDGVTYRSSWLGGALNFFIVDSLFITSAAGHASPCVPGAGILHHPHGRDGDVVCYDVPPDWWDDQEPKGLNLGAFE